MTFAVRALSLFLTVWLTAASAFPPCCWSMTYAHEHHETPSTSSGDAASADHHHHHHGSGESVALAETATLTSIPGYDCDAEFDGVATITSAARPQADMRVAGETSTEVAVPPASAPVVAHADVSPPGTSCSSAFLNPLRI